MGQLLTILSNASCMFQNFAMTNTDVLLFLLTDMLHLKHFITLCDSTRTVQPLCTIFMSLSFKVNLPPLINRTVS